MRAWARPWVTGFCVPSLSAHNSPVGTVWFPLTAKATVAVTHDLWPPNHTEFAADLGVVSGSPATTSCGKRPHVTRVSGSPRTGMLLPMEAPGDLWAGAVLARSQPLGATCP